jgi:hypothetical protein
MSAPAPAPHTVEVNLNIAVAASGDINIFGEPLPTVENVVVAETKLPAAALYTATNSMFEFWEPSSDPDTRLAELATTEGRNWKLLTDSLEKGIQACLEGEFNVEAASPFKLDKYNGMYDSVLNFGDLAYRSYLHYVLGHVDATFAISNDAAFKRAMLSHDASSVYKYATTDAVDYSIATITGSNADAKLAQLLVKAIASKDGAAVLAIADQVIGQDASRATEEDNNEITTSKRQALKFIAGDVIYMNIQLQTPNIVLGNAAQQVSKTELEGRFTGENYTLKITLE